MGRTCLVAGLTAAAVASIAWATGTADLVLRPFTGGPAPEVGFRLEAEVQDEQADTEPITLRHPVPADLRSNWPAEDRPPTLLEATDWWSMDTFSQGQGWLLDPLGAWRPVNPYRSSDFASRWVSVIDGSRRSWASPPCGCTRLTAWMYGGSTTFGLNQRDEHTIASELARAAAAAGIVLDVENRGEMGQLHWQEAERFRLDLLVDEAPDLVIFYDGANDSWAANTIVNRGTDDIAPPIDPTLDDLWLLHGPPATSGSSAPDGARFLGFPTGITTSSEELARLTVVRYDRSRRLSEAAARHAGIVARYVWQPTRYTRDLNLAEPHGDAGQEHGSRLIAQLAAAQLPDDVIDLTDALDEVDEPLYTDDVHHIEAGAPVIARALFVELEPDLRRLLQSREGGD